MQTLQRAFSQLRLVASAVSCSSVPSATSQSVHMVTGGQVTQTVLPRTKSFSAYTTSVLARCFTTKPGVKQGTEQKVKSYEPKSPYQTKRPYRYGFETKYFTGGLLPRDEHLSPIQNMPKYKPRDQWSRKKALFGQNDYIDILGDGSLKPMDLLHGPSWLMGFKGNELQRLSRRMKFEGRMLSVLYPTQFKNMRKRIWFLYKKYNRRRGKRIR